MGFDLMKLEEPYRSGRLIKKTEKSVELLSPVGRISFPKLSKPVAMEGSDKARFSVGMIWNVKDPTKPAFVNLNKPVAGYEKGSQKPSCLWAELKSFAEAQKVVHTLNDSKLMPFTVGQKYRSDGEPLDGYGPWTVSASFSKYPQGTTSSVDCYGPNGEKIDPTVIEMNAGFFGRFRLEMYVNKPRPGVARRVCLALISVQLLANGERFGGGPVDTSMEAVEGATLDVSGNMNTGFGDPDGSVSAGLDAAFGVGSTGDDDNIQF